MDKLRAIQYFTQAADSGSFAATARQFRVSAPAVVQLVGALERSLGSALFHRTTKGLTLTAEGERYYEVSSQVTTNLRDVEQRIGPRGARPRGTLTVGMRRSVGMRCVLPRIARFIADNPDIDLVIRPSFTVQDIDDRQLDLALLVGWPPERDGEQRTIDVKMRMVGDDLAWLGEAAAGVGVLRVVDPTLPAYLSSGRLVPALMDWEALEAPLVFAAYPRIQRRSRLVRVFLDFLVEVFADIEVERSRALGTSIPRVPKPEWFGRTHGRQSAFGTRGRKMAL